MGFSILTYLKWEYTHWIVDLTHLHGICSICIRITIIEVCHPKINNGLYFQIQNAVNRNNDISICTHVSTTFWYACVYIYIHNNMNKFIMLVNFRVIMRWSYPGKKKTTEKTSFDHGASQIPCRVADVLAHKKTGVAAHKGV